jgi:hypothetical protein
MSTLARIKAPVFSAWVSSICATVCGWPSAARSSAGLGHADGATGLGQQFNDPDPGGGVRRAGCEAKYAKREHLQRIARQDGSRLVERLVAGRATAPQVVVVHGWQVIVHERVTMYELDRARRRVDALQRDTQGLRRGIHERRPDALAGAEHAVTLRGVQASGHLIGCGQPPVEFTLDPHAPAFERSGQRFRSGFSHNRTGHSSSGEG